MVKPARWQRTLGERVTLSGVGVHTGQAVKLALNPAEAGTGIAFLRSDVDGDALLPAEVALVGNTDHCTTLSRNNVAVATIEHLMAAFRALGVDNALVEVDGPELPIMDGSSAAFVEAIDEAGIVNLSAPRRYIKVLRTVRVENGAAFGELRPHGAFRLETEIDFAHPLIGRSTFAADVTADLFRKELSRARTFGHLSDVERFRSIGLARGASLDNCIVLADDRVVNAEGLRYPDEFVRHKALDAVGDLSLAGLPILGAYRSYRGGHALNVRMVRALLADREAWTIAEAPSRQTAGHAEVPGLTPAPAFSPDVS
jgi:UDP-3-O-[3-hydroxymyristoyl] N-acetylglucosamine deacetylase